MGKICKFVGIIIWLAGIKFFVDTYFMIKKLSGEDAIFVSENLQLWIPVFAIFVYGLVLFVLGMIYDAVIKIQEERNKTEINWDKLFSKLEQLEKNMAAPQLDSTPYTGTQMPQNTMTWTCTECGHKNSSSEQVCSICGLAKKYNLIK